MKRFISLIAILLMLSLAASCAPEVSTPIATAAPMEPQATLEPSTEPQPLEQAEPTATALPTVDELNTLEDILLYEGDNLGPLTPKYVEAEEAAKGNTISAELKKAAEQMPSVSVSALPKWRGTSLPLDTMERSEGRHYFAETDVKAIKLMGFNFVRVMLDYREFTDETGELLYDETMLENFDKLIGWFIKYGIHASVDMHVAPGYHTDDGTTLLDDEVAYARCVELWQVFAMRYSDVSANALSYNLLNEPDLWVFTEENYAKLCNDLVTVVRAADADKLILSDGMLGGGWDRACPSRPNTLLDPSIGQTVHIYPFNADNQSNFISILQWPYDEMPSISGNINCDGSTLTLEGDFPQGTVVHAYARNITGVNEGNSLVLKADSGKEYVSKPLDGFDENGGYDYSIDYEWNNEMVRFDCWTDYDHNGYEISFTLDEAASSLLLTTNSGNLSVGLFEILLLTPCETEKEYLVPLCFSGYFFSYEKGAYDATYISLTEDWVDEPCTVHINGDGTFTCDDPNGTTDVFDMNTLEKYVREWKEWSEATGAPMMCNELEEVIGLPVEARVKYMQSIIELLEKYEIPWCIYSNNLEGPLCHEEQAQYQPMPQDNSLTKVGEYYVDYPMLEALQAFFE